MKFKLYGSMRIFTVLLLASLWSQGALAWWNDAWPYRLPIAIDASPAGANLVETNTDVTVLLKLHSGNFEDFFLLKQDLSDLRFVGGDDKTPLKFHVENFDFINQLIYVWVKVPKITGGINTEKIWMYYGNAEAVDGQDAGGSFDANTVLDFHFKAGEAVPKDSTAYASDAGGNSGVVQEQSLIGAGLSLVFGKTLNIPAHPALGLDLSRGETVSMWLKPAAMQQEAWVFEQSDGVSSVSLGISGNEIFARLKTESGEEYVTPRAPAVSVDTWQHVALVLAPSRLSVFVGGNEVAFAVISLEAMHGAFNFGGAVDGKFPFAGEIDELRIDNVARTADWLKTAVATQGLNNRLLIPQPGEQLGSGGGGSGLFGVLINSVEESGWTVIMLLAVMAAVSYMVMIGKFLYIRRVIKDNSGFLQAYQNLGDNDLARLDHEETEEEKSLADSPITQAIFGSHDHFQSSPIYHLYHRGIKEVQARMGRAAGAQASHLTPSAVEAIRAALQSQIVREAQRLNSKMVLLTIAISGGPFLGLLGTVLGVMITFAAIAATGDVNISAIAPGVAAALLTTVAGLVVAIPSLFGYNYLMSQIKASVSDMRVFGDEIVTRLAEYYGE